MKTSRSTIRWIIKSYQKRVDKSERKISFRRKNFSFILQKTLRTGSLNLGIVLIHLTRSSGKTHSALRTRSQWTVPWGLTAGVSNVQDYPQSSIRRVGYQSTVAVDEYQVPLVNPMVKMFRTFCSAKCDTFETMRTEHPRTDL